MFGVDITMCILNLITLPIGVQICYPTRESGECIYALGKYSTSTDGAWSFDKYVISSWWLIYIVKLLVVFVHTHQPRFLSANPTSVLWSPETWVSFLSIL